MPTGEMFNRQIRRATLKADKIIGGGQFGDVYLAMQTLKVRHGGDGWRSVHTRGPSTPRRARSLTSSAPSRCGLATGDRGQAAAHAYRVQILRNNASAKDKEQFLKEAEVMLELDDPSLVRMVGVAVQQQPCLVVLEFMPYGDLLRVIRVRPRRKTNTKPAVNRGRLDSLLRGGADVQGKGV